MELSQIADLARQDAGRKFYSIALTDSDRDEVRTTRWTKSAK